ncbi:MAG: hypothetical protein ABIZ04_19755 [Opitutus sp.]
MHFKSLVRSPTVRIYAALVVVGVMWAIYTNHAWEDYYITYRASKNLATGHGLTFTIGERVHSFTSPLGVLLPAFSNLLTAHRSDYAALWIFRLMSIAAYAGAGVLLWKLANALRWHSYSAALLVALFAIDAKIVDFSTNGMETGFLMLFLAWTLFALLTRPPRVSLHLGLAWAGLMWTRPDSFIYIFVLSAGVWLVLPRARAFSRGQLLKEFAAAGVITAVLYAPWLIWAWSYYGSPIPHTITAKGLFHSHTTLTTLGHALQGFPSRLAAQRDILTTTFMPPYSFNTGWPALALQTSYWVSVLCLVVWLIPGVRPVARIASFAFFWGQFYLTTYVEFPVPWYIPTLTVFALLVICNLVDQALELCGPTQLPRAESQSRLALIGRRAVWIGSSLLAIGALTISAGAAHQLKLQQSIIEHGQRREIGRWLRTNSSPGDTVFLEPLGYIGFYSNLKMLDYPGLSSPEVVAARLRASTHDYPGCWPELIMDLAPSWLVLRSYEAEAIRKQAPELLSGIYTPAKTFDVRAAVNAIPSIQGRGYLLNDSVFEVFRLNTQPMRNGRRVAGTRPIRVGSLSSGEAFGGPAKDVGLKIAAHAPSLLKLPRLVHARWLTGSFGIEPGAYANQAAATDGASFRIHFTTTDGHKEELFRRDLNPRDQPEDRGSQSFSVDLPGDAAGTIELEISEGVAGSKAFDWTYWSFLRFEMPADH